jgi:hypothetical protein
MSMTVTIDPDQASVKVWNAGYELNLKCKEETLISSILARATPLAADGARKAVKNCPPGTWMLVTINGATHEGEALNVASSLASYNIVSGAKIVLQVKQQMGRASACLTCCPCCSGSCCTGCGTKPPNGAYYQAFGSGARIGAEPTLVGGDNLTAVGVGGSPPIQAEMER